MNLKKVLGLFVFIAVLLLFGSGLNSRVDALSLKPALDSRVEMKNPQRYPAPNPQLLLVVGSALVWMGFQGKRRN